MSDLFHDDIPDEYIASVFAVMARAAHTFQILTKRHARMRSLLVEPERRSADQVAEARDWPACFDQSWPLPNVWLGRLGRNQSGPTSASGPLDTPAAVRFLSCEPLLGPLSLEAVDWTPPGNQGFPGVHNPLTGEWWPAVGDAEEEYANRVVEQPRLDWVVVGGESGPNARPMHPEWVRRIRRQCTDTDVPFFFKQWGQYLPATVEDDPSFAGGRDFNDPRGGRHAAALRPGDRTRGYVMLDNDTVAVKVGKTAAGRELDGRTWDEYPVVAR